jgi:hypothetical protein
MNFSNESIRWLADEHIERRLQEASNERLARAVRATTRRRRAPRITRRLPLFGVYGSRIDPVGPQS